MIQNKLTLARAKLCKDICIYKYTTRWQFSIDAINPKQHETVTIGCRLEDYNEKNRIMVNNPNPNNQINVVEYYKTNNICFETEIFGCSLEYFNLLPTSIPCSTKGKINIKLYFLHKKKMRPIIIDMLPWLAIFCVLFLPGDKSQTKKDSDIFQNRLTHIIFFKGGKSSLKEVDSAPHSGPCLLV